MEKIFEKWCEKLLDLGKGNRLINFKPTLSKTVEILAPYTSTFFNKIKANEKLSFYDVDEYVNQITKVEEDDFDEYKFDETLLYGKKQTDGLTDTDIKTALEYKLNKNQILAYKRGWNLKTVLDNIRKSAKESLNEKGINILYLSFGFLKWSDGIDNFMSPLLLVPIKLENDNKRNPFYISLYEDEITTNPTLIYKLKAEHNLTIPEYADDEHENETIMEYFLRVKEFAKNAKFEVLDNVYIGLFSFHKIDMYNDLKTNEQKILQNKNILKLLNLAPNDASDILDSDYVENFFKGGREIELHNVVDADASQTEAIIKASAGESFVLQGPPGTGKSQTITNLIAEFLYNDKKVLFVSEKLTALKVVFNNLKKVGLSDFCLELHSNMANKRDVIKELYRTLNLSKSTTAERAKDELDKLKFAKNKLDSYASELHKKASGVEKTPFELLNELSEFSELGELNFAFNDISSFDINKYNLVISYLEKYAELTKYVGRDYRESNWYGLKCLDSTYENKINLKKNLEKALDYIESIEEFVKDINKNYNTNILTLNDFYYYINLFEIISKLTNLDKALFEVNNLDNISNLAESCSQLENEILENKKVIDQIFTNKIYNLDVVNLRKNFKVKYKSIFRFLNKNYKLDKFEILDCLKQEQKLSYKQILDYLNRLVNVVDCQTQLDSTSQKLYNIIKKENVSSFDSLYKDAELLKANLNSDFDYLINEQIDYKSIKQQFKNLCQINKQISLNKKSIEYLTGIFVKYNFYMSTIEKVNTKVTGILNTVELFEKHNLVASIIEILQNLNALEFLDAFLDSDNETSLLVNYFKKEYNTQWLYYIIAHSDTLKQFDRISQDQAVEQFSKKDKLKFEISRAQIISKISSKRPSLTSAVEGGEVKILAREANKVRKQMPVRKLLTEIPEVVQILKPCFLMSPLSVSTFLINDKMNFDVVIFDEASQIYPWDAIGSIYRAEQAIIVGDSKQMPPTNFFVSQVEETDEYNEDMDASLDFESILDLCASSFDQANLKWHYRSKDERLIAFSNKNYYNGNLVTFPASTLNKQDYGVQFEYVEDGVFDRKTKTNINEAKKIVDMVFEHFKKYPERSLGVVAFSISQQNIIERLIEKRRANQPEYNRFFDENLKEPFIVKNLETIQGDERDTIIFSVAYAKDSNGKFIHNFGPLNQKGGERRLNVAITRAKINVKLVASIKGYDIDLKRTQSEGARLLKEYLDYAEAGNNMLVESKEETTSKLYTEIYNFLSAEGYDVDLEVGYSNFKIDLAVKSKIDPTKYILAIECDGNTYNRQRTTRDRDRLRKEVLERMGWCYYRVWSTDWFLNKEVEKKRILDTLSNLEKGDNKNVIEEPVKTQDASEFIVKKNPENDLLQMFKTYEKADTKNLRSSYLKGDIGFKGLITSVVKAEEPISLNMLLNRIIFVYNRPKANAYIKADFTLKLKNIVTIVEENGFYRLIEKTPVELRVPRFKVEARDVEDISIIELADGMLKIIKNNVGITKEGIFKTLSKLLMFSRLTERITDRFDKTLNSLLKQKLVTKNGELYFLQK